MKENLLKEYYNIQSINEIDLTNYSVRWFYKLYNREIDKLWEVNKEEINLRVMDVYDRMFVSYMMWDFFFYSCHIHDDIAKYNEKKETWFVIDYKWLPIWTAIFSRNGEKLQYFVIHKNIKGRGLWRKFIELLKERNLITSKTKLSSNETKKNNPTWFWEKMWFKKEGEREEVKNWYLQPMKYTN